MHTQHMGSPRLVISHSRMANDHLEEWERGQEMEGKREEGERRGVGGERRGEDRKGEMWGRDRERRKGGRWGRGILCVLSREIPTQCPRSLTCED